MALFSFLCERTRYRKRPMLYAPLRSLSKKTFLGGQTGQLLSQSGKKIYLKNSNKKSRWNFRLCYLSPLYASPLRKTTFATHKRYFPHQRQMESALHMCVCVYVHTQSYLSLWYIERTRISHGKLLWFCHNIRLEGKSMRVCGDSG